MIKYLSPCSSPRVEPDPTYNCMYFFDDYGRTGQLIGVWTVIPKPGWRSAVHNELQKMREKR